MAKSKLRTDPTTEARLGSEVLEDLRVSLWPVDCQTCGRPFGRWERPALEVRAEDGFAAASLHHRRCRPPAWVEGTPGNSGRRHLTWRAGCFQSSPGGLPIFLVNPSYEYALLRQDDDEAWRISTLKAFTGLGFQLEPPTERLPPLPGLSVSIDQGQVTVTVRHDGGVPHHWHDVPIPADITKLVHRWGFITVAVTTLMDVRKPFTIEQFFGLMAMGQVAQAQAQLTSISYSGVAQQVRPDEHPLDGDKRVELFALAAEAIRRAHGFEVDDDVLGAALALCEGKAGMIGHLTGRDRSAALLMVSLSFSFGSRESSGELALDGGVHLITPDAESADEYVEFFAAAVAEGVGEPVGRLGAAPLSDEGGTAYLADIVIGTADEYAAAYTAYSEAGPDWEPHALRGGLAIVPGTASSDVLRADFLRHYPKILTVTI